MIRRRASSADLAIPDGILRRLGQIENELPRTPRWRPAGSGGLHVVRATVRGRTLPEPARRFRLEPIAAAIVVVAVLGGGFILGRSVDGPGSPPTPSAPVVLPQFTPLPSAAASSDASLAPVDPSLTATDPELLRGPSDPAGMIARKLGWTCRLHTDITPDPEAIRMVDKLVAARGLEEGFPGPDGQPPIWVGTDVIAAAEAFKAALIARDDLGVTWIVVWTGKGAIARELVPERTAQGRLTWQLGDIEQPIACDAAGRLDDTAPPKPNGRIDGRSGYRVVWPATFRSITAQAS